MTLDEAIESMRAKISAASPGAQVKVVKMSDEEARLTVLAPASDIQGIKEATFLPAMDFLNHEGFDLQVQIYDQSAPPLTA